ncbi:hypothetical protein FHU41_002429 [Psychromicrobium silvestre]|uniref:TfoX N-terminal domain-containing protein n=1 Tax=Psychromicrobium silvestre TaxID=1645614 RepID=A0A7Y9LV72_9MICC|nr:hypothetical protein [Psychromicrobium silvestre]NYE96179.1 hypothetical protein [Psychromicrobium silvestre]
MDIMESSEQAVAAFEAVAEELAGSGTVPGNTFGARALMVDKKAIACLHGEAMAFKLGRDSSEHAKALALAGATLFDPSGMHRPFKDWVEIPVEFEERWLGFAQAALQLRIKG